MTIPPDSYEVLGYRVRVTAPDEEARRAIRSILGGFGPVEEASGTTFVPYRLVTDGPEHWTVFTRSTLSHTAPDFATALAALEWHILTDALARCRDLFHLHGAALAAPGGRDGVLLIGDSGSGKTTLTLGLILRGFAPLSDDVTLVDTDTLAARPFPRAFHLEEGTRDLLARRALPATWDLAAMPPGYFRPPAWATAPAAIRCIIFPQYQPGASPQLIPLPIADAASALLAHTISLVRVPKLALATVSRLTAAVPCYRMVSGDLDPALDAIIAQVAPRPAAAGPHAESVR